MSLLLVFLHIAVCIVLIMVVLLQTGKGTDMGAAFGGGSSQTLFGSAGASTFLSKATTFAAVVFMLTSLGLAYLSSHKTEHSIMTDIETTAPMDLPVQENPVQENDEVKQSIPDAQNAPSVVEPSEPAQTNSQ